MFEEDKIEVTRDLIYHVVEGDTVTPIDDPGELYELMISKGYRCLTKEQTQHGQKQIWVRLPKKLRTK